MITQKWIVNFSPILFQDFERVPHQYTKRNNDYWTTDIFVQRRKKPRLCVDVREEEVPMTQANVDSMSPRKIKDALKSLNIKTKVRKLKLIS